MKLKLPTESIDAFAGGEYSKAKALLPDVITRREVGRHVVLLNAKPFSFIGNRKIHRFSG